MKNKYFKKYPVDSNPNRARDALGTFMSPPGSRRDGRLSGQRLRQAEFLEKIWARWHDTSFKVGPNYIATWSDRPMGFSMSKVWSPNYFFDRCVIENPDDPYSYALFDLVSKSGHDGWIFVAFDVQEYHLTADDEMLIRLSI